MARVIGVRHTVLATKDLFFAAITSNIAFAARATAAIGIASTVTTAILGTGMFITIGTDPASVAEALARDARAMSVAILARTLGCIVAEAPRFRGEEGAVRREGHGHVSWCASRGATGDRGGVHKLEHRRGLRPELALAYEWLRGGTREPEARDNNHSAATGGSVAGVHREDAYTCFGYERLDNGVQLGEAVEFEYELGGGGGGNRCDLSHVRTLTHADAYDGRASFLERGGHGDRVRSCVALAVRDQDGNAGATRARV